eukprot:1522467-Prymnesium_polylepis.1
MAQLILAAVVAVVDDDTRDVWRVRAQLHRQPSAAHPVRVAVAEVEAGRRCCDAVDAVGGVEGGASLREASGLPSARAQRVRNVRRGARGCSV